MPSANTVLKFDVTEMRCGVNDTTYSRENPSGSITLFAIGRLMTGPANPPVKLTVESTKGRREDKAFISRGR